MPRISVLCPSFNHERYVAGFIQSVLAQNEQDFELIIVDDCSSDNNVSEIKRTHDPKIRLIEHGYNKGINAGINTAFAAARGEYVVIIASDDLLQKEHLATTLKYFEEHSNVGAIYYDMAPMDENGNDRDDLKELYSNTQQDKYFVLKTIFLGSNCLMSPGMAIRRSVFEKYLYPLEHGILQSQDILMHVKLALHTDILTIRERLVRYRVPSASSGVSFTGSYQTKRAQLEVALIMEEYLCINNTDLLQKIFGERACAFGAPIAHTIPYVLGRLALESKDEYRKEWGYKTIIRFLCNRENADLLYEKYRVTFADIIMLVKSFSNSNLIAESKLLRYKKRLQIVTGVAIVLLLAIIALLFNGG